MSMFPINTISETNIKAVDIFPRKTLNLNFTLDNLHQNQLVRILQKYSSSFSWEYIDMKGIHRDIYIHNTYI